MRRVDGARCATDPGTQATSTASAHQPVMSDATVSAWLGRPVFDAVRPARRPAAEPRPAIVPVTVTWMPHRAQPARARQRLQSQRKRLLRVGTVSAARSSSRRPTRGPPRRAPAAGDRPAPLRLRRCGGQPNWQRGGTVTQHRRPPGRSGAGVCAASSSSIRASQACPIAARSHKAVAGGIHGMDRTGGAWHRLSLIRLPQRWSHRCTSPGNTRIKTRSNFCRTTVILHPLRSTRHDRHLPTTRRSPPRRTSPPGELGYTRSCTAAHQQLRRLPCRFSFVSILLPCSLLP